MTFFEGLEAGASDQPDAETLVRRVVEIINNARSLPLSSSVKLDNKDEVLELLGEALDRLPEELRQARWMLKEREEFLARNQRDADEILEQARVRAERMVQRTEIVREAQHTAKRTVEQARDEALRLRHEAEDYCDQKLAAFEVVLDRTMKTVQAGREKLRVTPVPPPDTTDSMSGLQGLGEVDPEDGDAFFDQDSPE
jgi:cell division septum initiation protein DivIVA